MRLRKQKRSSERASERARRVEIWRGGRGFSKRGNGEGCSWAAGAGAGRSILCLIHGRKNKGARKKGQESGKEREGDWGATPVDVRKTGWGDGVTGKRESGSRRVEGEWVTEEGCGSGVSSKRGWRVGELSMGQGRRGREGVGRRGGGKVERDSKRIRRWRVLGGQRERRKRRRREGGGQLEGEGQRQRGTGKQR